MPKPPIKTPTFTRASRPRTKKAGDASKKRTTNLLTSSPPHSRNLMRALAWLNIKGAVREGTWRSRPTLTELCMT